MRFPILVVRFALLLAALLCAGLPGEGQLWAQVDPGASPPGNDGASPAESEPQVFFLRDERGELIFVPDFSFERWEQLTKIERNLLPPTPPAYTFQRELLLVGEVQAEFVQFEATCLVQLTETAPGDTTKEVDWIRVPLQLNQAIRAPQFDHTGPGEVIWTYQDQSDGHVIWVRAPRGSEHLLRWSMKVPLVREGERTHFSIRAPATAVRLRLSIPDNNLLVTLSDPDSQILTRQDAAGGKTQVSVEGVGGELSLSWRARDDTPPLLEATGSSRVRLDGQQIESTAQLRVRSFGLPITSFLVRLPPETELAPLPPSETEFTPVETAPAENARAGPLVRVARRDGRPSNEFVVELQAVRPIPPGRPTDTPLETGGFDVVGAVRQSGVVDFEVKGDWTVDWIPGRYVRQAASESDLLGPEASATRFIYNRQPYSLQVRVSPRESRVTVEPRYVLDVGADQLRLAAQLGYRISGAGAKELQIDLPGWTVDRVLPADYVADHQHTADRLTVRLSPQASTVVGELQIQVVAHRTYDRNQLLDVSFPRPRATTSAPATVAIVSAENVQLVPRNAELEGLVADTLPLRMPLPVRQQPPLTYREDVAAETARFKAVVHVRQRALAVSVHTELQFVPGFVEVHQQMHYTIDFEPLSEVMWRVPAGLAAANRWDVTMNGQPLPAVLVRDETVESGDSSEEPTKDESVLLAVDLLQAQLGSVRLSFRYRLPINGSIPPRESVRHAVLLAQPVEDAYTTDVENTLQVTSSEFLEAKVSDQQWSLVASAAQPYAAPSEPVFRVSGRMDHVTLEILLARSQRQSTTTLEKVWLQTWLTNSVRRDRVSFRLSTNDSQIEFGLPAGVEVQQVAVNGRSWTQHSLTDGRLRVELEGTASPRHYTIELWYWSAAQSAPLGRIAAPIPQVIGVERAERLYWQLIVPPGEHLVWFPSDLTPEFVWQWENLHWGRLSNREQADLEDLLGSSVQEPIPAATNRYVFTSVGPLQTVEFLTARRAVLVIALSSITLAVGLCFIYLPPLRHPMVVMLLGLALLSASAVLTELAILAAQAAVLGLALVLIARLLQWALILRGSSRPLVFGRPPPSSESNTFLTSASSAHSRLSTAVSTMPYETPVSDPKP